MSLQYQSKQVDELSRNLASIEISTFFHSPDILCCLLKLRRDRTVPALDEVARDIIPAQLHPDPLASGENVGNSRGECAMVSSGGGSKDDDESGDSEDEGAGEETGGDKSGDSNREASDERDSEDSEDDHTRTPQTGTYSSSPMRKRTSPIHVPSISYLTRDEVEELLLDQRMLIEIRLCTVKLEIMQHVTNEFVKCMEEASPHCRSIMRKIWTRKCGADMEFEPALNGDDDEVASGGSGKREDDGVASPTGVAEADGGRGMDSEPGKNSHDDEVPSDGSGNRSDKPIASASGVAEVDSKYIAVKNSSCHPNPNS
ncbi:Hypothetical predicted protein [Olea europaea subsp. europaea]|uniref:Uncharacterized protein n=1 Tax=Olea europaea subsp. europaea TaxID=158383 RepID=A0A8S0TI93_OLEEU|nr:Hypothetical predicted protein [Olea europaea subsp. europaea]